MEDDEREKDLLLINKRNLKKIANIEFKIIITERKLNKKRNF